MGADALEVHEEVAEEELSKAAAPIRVTDDEASSADESADDEAV